MDDLRRFLPLLFTFFNAFSSSSPQPYIGINYGKVADNLPPPESTARLLESTSISKLRLYGVDPAIIRSLAGTNISLILGTTNADIPSLAASLTAASAWVSSNIQPFLPSSSIYAISVGNEVLTEADPSLSSQLLSAMQNLRSAVSAAAAGGADIKISTVHSMAVLSQSDPPSSGAFSANLSPSLNPILQFLHEHASPFMVNPYPYFAYQSDPRAETLAFCLFEPNSGRPDPGSGVTYTNMFDAQVGAVRAALSAAGFSGVPVVVAETGWPYRGDQGEEGATVENARAYNGNLVTHLRAMADPVETYIFALYDEDLKPGPLSERSFGLFSPDRTPIYDVGLLKAPVEPSAPPVPAPSEGVSSGPSEGVTPPPPPISRIAPPLPPELAPAGEVCGVKGGRGGGTCGQPVTQDPSRSSDKSGERRLRIKETLLVLDFALLVFFRRLM
ncbi:Glucan endo-1,3-beta-glucosidase 7 [Platanthera guangdongensis]|uniref:Glucan endo-1,3-beta-glucosidase 7 n=1 Tax=Platanthera guangdongensis TaxID=2320717 RepID=A0ABR2LCW0_9ASPA